MVRTNAFGLTWSSVGAASGFTKTGAKTTKGPILAPSPWEYDEKSSASLGRAALRLWRDVALGGPAEHIEEKMAKKKKAAAKKGGGAKAKGKAKTNPILSLGVPRFGCALVPSMRASLWLRTVLLPAS